MRIALVTDYYLPTLGGVQTVIKAHREALTAAGHEVWVFAPLAEPSKDAGIIRLPSARGFAPDGYPFTWPMKAAADVLRAELLRLDIDVMHVHTEMFAALAGLRTAAELGIPVVQTMHGRIDVYTHSVLPLPALTAPLLAWMHRRGLGGHEPFSGPRRPYTRTRSARQMWRLMRSHANRADQVIVPSAHFARKLADHGVTTPITVLSNGLEESVLDTIGEPEVRSRIPGELLRVAWCGRVSPEKRPEVFLDAVTRVPGIAVDMYGDGVSRRIVQRRARALPDGRLRVHGSVPQAEVLAGMRDAHVLVSTSWDFDNQPMVLLEAIASGLPVIVADPDLAEALPPGGHLVTSAPDAEGLAAALIRLRDYPALVRTMSAAVTAHRPRIAQNTHLDALIAVYQRALAARPDLRRR
ncbi:Glycosyltransferase [Microbacterium esteraromaticum]|uniref:D-inositol 3-phosphate glycosyltransferase n=1 Tax=Microbacterium esteraromaticum TaxID=57043 RepID=A0A1R4IUT3_9MICO|nr:glycosyltransferase [Microbacterium esteraromaticum]SJN23478.1 Glycosyltransferase [Microbacterium esteraromaticum]